MLLSHCDKSICAEYFLRHIVVISVEENIIRIGELLSASKNEKKYNACNQQILVMCVEYWKLAHY